MGRRASASGSDAGGPALHVALFGKHPAWADFLSVGLETDELRLLEQVLFDQGIDGNIASGVWGDPKERGQEIVERFNHAFVMLNGAGLLIGQWWPSRDRVGRSRPLAVCIQTESIPFARAIRVVFAQLHGTVPCLQGESSQQGVVAIVDGLRVALRAALCPSSLPPPDHELSFCPSLSWFLAHDVLSGDGDSLLRLLFLVKEALDFAESQPQHLRLPVCGTDAVETGVRWLDLLTRHFAPDQPCLLLMPADAAWVDLVVGQPDSLTLLCLGNRSQDNALDDDLSVAPSFLALAEKALGNAQAKGGDVLLREPRQKTVVLGEGSGTGRSVPAMSSKAILALVAIVVLLIVLAVALVVVL
ncbi:MAG: DUF2094 domain-containing protein [Lentisphaerae bacterium]|jgi:hypothetical protein|nr:DUF2094 domain-containing protein [Lentisphaerota bacterium]MBT4816627.1 DUF2094 domain-containing protein [Lentisphaerota bacterium]MBT5607081.1 DUF2094 domain-containing protein [Lentisphaerota bacterium]MBT7057188.1 DUF2094 domain-containing protein [Lentisphaerota bacterium]MBT7844511.1 DUF2094 domain-containing protein [Lentisphaerota bacterium]